MAKGSRVSEQQPNKVPSPAADCREAIHWFVDNVGLYSGSTRGLFVSDFSEAHEPILESAIINLKSRGIVPLVIEGESLYKQAAYLWDQAIRGTTFGRPVATKFELELTAADVLILKSLPAPENAQQLWYLYHQLLYPRSMTGRATLITTGVDYWEFLAAGANCDDLEYGGRRATWEKVLWLMDATMIDLYHFRQVKDDGLAPMIKAEYYLLKTLKERGLNVVAQHVIGDYMLDFAIVEKNNKLDIECDVITSLDSGSAHSGEAKRNLVLLSDGWKILKFTNSEILSNVVTCADAVEDVWLNGRKKASFGRLISGQANVQVPEPPVDDDVQRLAISHGAGPCAITGGAGSGKTSCLAYRVAYLLAHGINPESILVVSYNKETLKGLRQIIDELVDRQLSQRVNYFPWHDLGQKILKENLSAIKRKPPLKIEQSSQKVIQRLLSKHKKDLDPVTLELSEELDEFTLASLISLYKANLVSPKHVKERSKGEIDELVSRVYQAYEDQLQKANRVDKDDLITLAALVLVDQPEVRARYQYQYEYVLVDEYQDATAACDLLARLLAFPQDNLYIAGDEDETIWEGKGSLPRLLPEVSLRLPNARCYLLEKNWRSHPVIVEHARKVMRYLERRRMQKDMMSGWGAAPTSAIVGPQLLPDEAAEAEWIADEMQVLIDSGRSPGEVAVLYRQNRYALFIEEALSRRNIRCLATHPEAGLIPDEVGDVMAFLRLVMDPDGPKARESFERVCQLRVKEVDPKLSATIASFAEANNLSYLKAVEIYSEAVAEQSCRDLEQLVRIIRTMNQENLPPSETISLLRRTQRLNDYYRSIKVPPGINYEPLRKLTQLEEEARQYKSVAEFVKAYSARQQEKGEDAAAVSVLSVNETKGQEFPIVFVVGLADGLFPADSASDLEEERRLFYVAMTRARELIYVSYPTMYNRMPLPPTPFLVEAGLMTPEFLQAAQVAVAQMVPVAAPAEPQQEAVSQMQPVPVQPSKAEPAPAAAPPPQVVAAQTAPQAAPQPVIQTNVMPPEMVPPPLSSQPPVVKPNTPPAPAVPHATSIPINMAPPPMPHQPAAPAPVSAPPPVYTPPAAPLPAQASLSPKEPPFEQTIFPKQPAPANRPPAMPYVESTAPVPTSQNVPIAPVKPHLPDEAGYVPDPAPHAHMMHAQKAIPEAAPSLAQAASPQSEPMETAVADEAEEAPEVAAVESTPEPQEPAAETTAEWSETAADLQNEAVPDEPKPEPAQEAEKPAKPEPAEKDETGKKKKRRDFDANKEDSSHNMLVGMGREVGSGQEHRASWMEQGPQQIVPHVSIPLPQDLEPVARPDIGVPVSKKGSPLFAEPEVAEATPLDAVPDAPQAPPPPSPLFKQAPIPKAGAGVFNAMDEAAVVPGIGSVPGVPAQKRSGIAWDKIDVGQSKGRTKEGPPPEEELFEEEEELPPAAPPAEPERPFSAPPVSPYGQAQPTPPPAMPNQHVYQSAPQAHQTYQQPFQQPPVIDEGAEHLPHCPHCSARLEVGSNFCGECGYKLEMRIPPCPACGCPLEPMAKFCGECGAKTQPQQAPSFGTNGGTGAQDAEAQKKMQDYLSGYGPDQKDRHWVQKLKKIID